ncbi:hypothetical protein [Alicyclobacillus sp. SO9]|uniref:hypothetical protein n=1 Tax=Alicyclobacillus sp. SO9 TaxID=2665646 RepID=UPI0018E87AAC|nr:hypothetical protein [Alicyclobacillus sp. SO9]QQE80940.1 hypothetical protein GI364_11445 [Alicyclobacillus sp. SO9]
MTDSYFPFTSGSGTQVDTSQWSMMARNWVPTGVIKGALNELAVTAAGTAMSVSVDTGRAFIMGGQYQNDASKAVQIAAADATNPRIDLIALRIDWSANTIGIVYLEGTAAASPVAPSLTQNDILSGGTRWEIPLAQVAVAANATAISSSDVTDERYYATEGTINIRAFGAKVDGVTDDSAPLIAALASEGMTIILPKGVCLIDGVPAFGTIKNVRIIGQNGSILRFNGPSSFNSQTLFTDMSHVQFENVTFEAPNAPLSAIIGSSTNVEWLKFRDCTFQDITPTFLLSAKGHVTFDKCTWTQTSSPPSTLAQTIGGVGEDFYVIDCGFNFAFNGGSGCLISVTTNQPIFPKNVWIVNNHFMDENQTGYLVDAAVDIEPNGSTQLENINILNNTFYNSRIYASGADRISIRGNRFRWTSVGVGQPNWTQIQIYNSSATVPPTGTVELIDNRIIQDTITSGMGGTPCPVKQVQACDRLVIRENRILMNTSGNAVGYMLELNTSSIESIIEENTFEQTNTNPNVVLIANDTTGSNGDLKIRRNKVRTGQWQHFVGLLGASGSMNTLEFSDNDLTEVGLSTGTNYGTWLYSPSVVPTRKLTQRNLNFAPGALGAPGIPSSGTQFTNPFSVPAFVFVTGGTVSSIVINGATTGLTGGSFMLNPEDTITLNYSGAPSWAWAGTQ